jgi:hypothetical protein
MESLNMTEKKTNEGTVEVVNLPFISGKSPEIVNLPKGAPPIVPSPPVEEEKPVRATDKTVKGGRYLVGGQLVNANNEPIKE